MVAQWIHRPIAVSHPDRQARERPGRRYDPGRLQSTRLRGRLFFRAGRQLRRCRPPPRRGRYVLRCPQGRRRALHVVDNARQPCCAAQRAGSADPKLSEQPPRQCAAVHVRELSRHALPLQPPRPREPDRWRVTARLADLPGAPARAPAHVFERHRKRRPGHRSRDKRRRSAGPAARSGNRDRRPR